MSQSQERFESRKLPMMPIRDVVIFPFMMTPFVVGRESSVRALEEALAGDKKIFLATQHDASIDEPKRVTGLFEQYVKLCQSLNYETMIAAVKMEDPAKLTDTIAANLQLSIEEKQELLDIFDPMERLTRIADVLDIEIEKLNMDRTIQSRVKRQMEKAQKEYYLNEKIKAIQKELGRGEKSEFDELKNKIESAGTPKEV